MTNPSYPSSNLGCNLLNRPTQGTPPLNERCLNLGFHEAAATTPQQGSYIFPQITRVGRETVLESATLCQCQKNKTIFIDL